MAVRLLDIRPGEGRLLAAALPFAFACVGVQTCAVIASDSLFVSAFDLGHLSRFYLVSGLLRVVVSLGYGMLSSRVSSARSDAGFLALTGASLLLSWGAVGTGLPALLYAVCVLLVLLPSVLPLVAMNTVMDYLDPRQARRLLPLMGAAATAGAMTMGGVANFLAPRLGTPSLLCVAAGLCLAAAPLPLALARRARSDARVAASAGKSLGPIALLGQGLRDMRAIDAVRVFAANCILASLTTSLVDFAFKAALKGHYGRDEMAAFLGTFNMVAEGVVMVAQIFLTSRILGRLGLRASLLSRPGLLLPFVPALAAVPALGVASAAKFVELTTRLSIGGTVADLLLAPIPPAVRTRAKVVAKAAPFGSLAAGFVLSLFGARGPSALAVSLLLGCALCLWLVALRGSGRAYMSALVAALARGGARLDVTRDTAELLRHELVGMLSESVRQSDVARAKALLDLAGDDLLTLDDLVPLVAAGGDFAAVAARAAIRSAKPGDGERLLELVPASDDDGLEREVLARARVLGATADRERLERAIARGEAGGESPASASLWAEALACLASVDRISAVTRLREAAADSYGPKSASGLAALGELREQSAQAEVERALASDNAAVFAEAARAAVLMDVAGAIPRLVSHLSEGTNARAAARALTFASPAGVSELLAALPANGGPVSVRGAPGVRSMAGTIRIARVLAKLGPGACERTLAAFDELGYHGRKAACRALASMPASEGRRLDPAHVGRAMQITIAYAERLHGLSAVAGHGLLGREIRHRIDHVANSVLDLAAALGDRALIARAKAGLQGGVRARANALELLENVLPRGLRAGTVALFERAPSVAGGAASLERFVDEDWLEICRRFDAGDICYEDPMRPVLEKLVLLHGCTLFGGLSGEELYPVAEIAELVTKSRGEEVVRQGDPGDALFVMVDGTVAVVLGGKRTHELGRGAAFGEMALLDGEPRAATIEAVTDAQLLRIPREQFDALIDESPELARGVIRTLIGHIRARG